MNHSTGTKPGGIAVVDAVMRTIAAEQSPGYPRLITDLLTNSPAADRFFAAADLPTLLREIDAVSYDREAIVQLLHEQHAEMPNYSAARNQIERLRDPHAVCLFAGQQAGLFGGAVFTQTKGLGVVLHARRLEQSLGRPVIPIFWVASDDHDIAEIDHTTVLARSGELTTIRYAHGESTLRPAWELLLGKAEIEQSLADLRSALGTTDFTEQVFADVESAYQPGRSYSQAFSYLIAHQLGSFGLLQISPGDTKLKQLAAPFFVRLVERAPELADQLQQTEAELRRAGYHLQVEKKPEYLHLFHHQPGRIPILRDGADFRAGSTRWSRAELLDELQKTPSRFSPDVIARPLLQSYLFPTVCQHGGPAELSYLAQIGELFSLMQLPRPIHRMRSSATIIEERTGAFLTANGIDLTDLFGDVEQVVNRLLAARFPADLEASARTAKAMLLDSFDQFAASARQYEQSVSEVASQMRGKIEFAFTSFESKLFAAHKKKSKDVRDKIYRLADALAPHRGFQERTINLLSWQARYGTMPIETLAGHLDPEELRHQIIPVTTSEQQQEKR